jgi:cobalt/nickel transport system ATP-binding protein
LFGPLQLGIGKEEIEKQFEEIITLLDIKDLLGRSPHQLSVGEKRKVAIASILAINPDILILDEPTAGLDPLTTRHIIDLLLRENAAGKTMITSTHDLHIVEEISDRVYVFNQEKTIIRSGTPVEILSDTALLQANNLVHIHGHIHHGKIHVHQHPPLEKHEEP